MVAPFELLRDPDSVFSFEVMDHGNFGAADFMGCCRVEIKFKRPQRAAGDSDATAHSVRSGNASRRWRRLDDALRRHRREDNLTHWLIPTQVA